MSGDEPSGVATDAGTGLDADLDPALDDRTDGDDLTAAGDGTGGGPDDGTALAGPPERSRGMLVALVAIIVLGLASATFALGTVVGGDGESGVPVPSDTSIDVGFTRDMIVHHQQAIQMAGIDRDNGGDPDVRLVAFDIETGQTDQVGQMQGWLQLWDKNPNNPGAPMSWMPDTAHHHVVNGLMPGMATPDQMAALRKAHGHALDIMFLKLMIRHHQGGIPMAQYAADHAASPVVRQVSLAMVKAQSAEVITMERTLRKLGGTPLPPP